MVTCWYIHHTAAGNAMILLNVKSSFRCIFWLILILMHVDTRPHKLLALITIMFKGPLKYLVAKLHGCYPGANSLPVSQNFFARFFRRRSVVDSSRCLTFLLRCNKHKKTLFAYNFFINVLLYGYNMWVVPFFFKLSCFAWKLHSRRDVLTESRSDGCMLMAKFRKDDSTRFPVSD